MVIAFPSQVQSASRHLERNLAFRFHLPGSILLLLKPFPRGTKGVNASHQGNKKPYPNRPQENRQHESPPRPHGAFTALKGHDFCLPPPPKMATSCRRSINTTINQRANIRRYEWAKVEVFRVPLKAPTCSPTLVCGRQLADRKPPPYVIHILRIYVVLSTLTSTFRPDS